MDTLKVNVVWLDNLDEAINYEKSYGPRLGIYLLSLEAWRRGLNVKFLVEENQDNKILIRNEINDGHNTFYFASSKGNKLSEQAIEICEDKALTKEHLEGLNIDTPIGRKFNASDLDRSILDYAERIGYPVVIKPLSSNTGTGVFSNIQNKYELNNSLHNLRNVMKYKEILLEKYFEGSEYRVLVLENKIIGIVKRIPANVIGDGKQTIEELVKVKNKYRNKNPNSMSREIKLDDEAIENLKSSGYTLNSVLPEKKVLFLKNKVTLEADVLEANNILDENQQTILLDMVKSIEGLHMCGIDIMINEETNQMTVIELNTRPMLSYHMFPFKGEPNDVMSLFIDSYFPETKNKEKSNLYFDFHSIIEPLVDMSAEQILLKSIKNEQIIAKSVKIKYVGNTSVRNLILNARRNNIHGNIQIVNNKYIKLIIGHEESEKLQEYIEFVKVNVEYESIEVQDYNKPIKVGFVRIKENKDKLRIKQLKQTNKRIQNDLNKSSRKIQNYAKDKENLETRNNIEIERHKKTMQELLLCKENLLQCKEELQETRTKLESMHNSKSWKLTKPLRKIAKKISNKGEKSD